MKSVSNKFKEEIKKYGRQIDIIISYTDNEGEHLLDSDVLFSITPSVNGNILKSVMKQLNFESSVKVPKDTIINVKFGVQIDLSLTVEEVHNMKLSRLNSLQVAYLSNNLKGFEYVSLGNYIVSKEPEYNADTLSYNHICYDKMLYSMKDYKKLNITYPVTVREYINKICESIGLTFKNSNNTFANYNKQIKLDLYDGYDYKYRDILDELAQVTASTICINENTDELEIRYLNDTQDTIDEDYLKDINVKFEERYGPVNSIVLSRSAESDNVFLQDEISVEQDGLCELKIIDNQIMNDNDRSDFLPDILEKINGLNYYINDFNSTGIVWYELCDKYTISIENKLYNCVLFNDEIKITQGLEETIYTEIPEVTKTDYSKSDKTDRKINKAYIMVDKQNQKITQLISQTTQHEEKLTQVEQDIEGVTTEIKDSAKGLQDKITQIDEKIDGIAINKTITGGQNLIRNSVGYFRHEYWQIDDENEGTVINNTSSDVKQNSTSGSALEIQAETIYQNINEIQNGEYYLSFNYKVTKENTVCNFKINNEEIELTEQNWTEVERLINVTTNSIKIEITSDIASSLLITDLMLSAGNTKVSWSQNSNESYSDGVQIGKGLKIKSTGSDTELNADAEGINVKNTSTGENVAEFTKYGTTTEELTVNKNIELANSLLIQKVGEQTWFCSL